MKVSFDFDNTLSRKDVQRFAKELVSEGVEVWIVTSRYATNSALEKGWNWIEKQNQELYDVAEECGVKKEHIFFTEHTPKIDSIKNNNFLFHLDDNSDELWEIKKSNDPCLPVNVEHFDWELDCRAIIGVEKILKTDI